MSLAVYRDLIDAVISIEKDIEGYVPDKVLHVPLPLARRLLDRFDFADEEMSRLWVPDLQFAVDRSPDAHLRLRSGEREWKVDFEFTL